MVIKHIPAKILIVDDREDNHLSLETILEGEGFTFFHAMSGKEALRILLEETDFALIIMDVVMPGMDGFETADFIFKRVKLREVPILFLTANGTEEQLFEAFRRGAVDYITKPVNPHLLRAKVNVFIELSRKNRILEKQKKELKSINNNLETEINERKSSEKKIKTLNSQLNKKLKELEALDSFSYMVSHDFKGPLSNISLIAQILLKNESVNQDSQAKELISKIDTHIFRLNSLINDLLLFSHHDHKIQREDVDMNQVVQEVMDDVKMTYQLDNKVRIKVDKLPVVNCNPNLIKQVWNNLLSNSIKYSKVAKEPAIRIKTDLNDKKHVFSVIDNGIGFSTEESGNLFDVFSRLDSSKKIEGSGVGLAIVKRIIDKHGGKIWAESEPGKGSKFSFYV